jgi:FKBP-type peptidyl-prolyl cis-trans isomerase FkpA/FKBP-type peptidyl-prolyl cis-trans isomerase FklB
MILALAMPPVFAAEPQVATEEEKVLYTIGLALSRSSSRFALSEAEFEVVKLGFTDGVLHRKEKVRFEDYIPKVSDLANRRTNATVALERTTGEAYRQRALTEPGARQTASGLVVIPLKPGSGATPTATNRVKLHYEGRTLDGAIFDSTKTGLPLNVVVGTARVECLVEGVQLLKAGGKSRIICPPELTEGLASPMIKPGATLVYTIELEEIVN